MAQLLNFIKKQTSTALWVLGTLNDVVSGPELDLVQPKHSSIFRLDIVGVIIMSLIAFFLYILQEYIGIRLKNREQ